MGRLSLISLHGFSYVFYVSNVGSQRRISYVEMTAKTPQGRARRPAAPYGTDPWMTSLHVWDILAWQQCAIRWLFESLLIYHTLALICAYKIEFLAIPIQEV